MDGGSDYGKAVLRSQQTLIAMAVIVAVVGAVIGSFAVAGSAMIALAVPGILGGFGGLMVCRALSTRGDSAIQIMYPVLLVIGLLALAVFFIVRIGRAGPDIGLGGVLIFALLVGLPGAFGTGAIIWARRHRIGSR